MSTQHNFHEHCTRIYRIYIPLYSGVHANSFFEKTGQDPIVLAFIFDQKIRTHCGSSKIGYLLSMVLYV